MMSQGQRTLLLTIAGLLAGVLVGFAIDKTTFLLALTIGGGALSDGARSAIVGAFVGGMYGLFLGVADCMTVTGIKRRIAALLAAFVLGALAGVVAMRVHPILPTQPIIVLAGPSPSTAGDHVARTSVAARTLTEMLAWTIIGAALGACPGLVRRDGRRAVRGALGGAAGALIGGAIVHATAARHAVGALAGLGYALAGMGVGLLPALLGTGEDGDEKIPESAATVPDSPAADTPAESRVEPVSPAKPDAAPVSDVTRPSADERRGVFDASELLGMAAELICVAGPYSGQRFRLTPGADITIGRGADQDIALVDDTAASRAHASILVQDGRHVLVDHESANGTYLNEAVVTTAPRRLFRGDILRVGRTELRYEPDEHLL
ncbi:MAG TPA: FHA domain-containing protein [Capsulimonadaceae bacterium]|jgi:hypothetical protein